MGEYERGYHDAIEACRDAVEALHGATRVASAVRVWQEALAAIDALRGES